MIGESKMARIAEAYTSATKYEPPLPGISLIQHSHTIAALYLQFQKFVTHFLHFLLRAIERDRCIQFVPNMTMVHYCMNM
jgi:hypothetical protein